MIAMSEKLCRPGLRGDLIPVSGRDMLQNAPGTAAAEFVPLITGPQRIAVCSCLVGRPCTHSSGTAGVHGQPGSVSGSLPATAAPTSASSSSSAGSPGASQPGPAFPETGPAYGLRPRSRHLDPAVTRALLEDVTVLQTPVRKRAASVGTGCSPAYKQPAAEGDPPQAVQRGETASTSSSVAGRFFCPFPFCAQTAGRGAGWGEARRLFVHVNNVHLSAGDQPPAPFLCGRCFSTQSGPNRKRHLRSRALRKPGRNQWSRTRWSPC